MKTSKKLLSLFLAAVMVISSCSVGFTAFAADGNNTDSNLTYWNDSAEAQAAFDTLEGLANQLLEIPAIKKVLEDNKIPYKDKNGNADISAIIKGVSPTLADLLLNKIGGLGIDLSSFIGKFTYTRDDFLQDKLGISEYNPNDTSAEMQDKVREYRRQYQKLQSALDENNESVDFINFYTLYYLTRDNQGNDNDFQKYCKETFPKLEALYQSCEKSDDEKQKEFLDNVLSNTNFFPQHFNSASGDNGSYFRNQKSADNRQKSGLPEDYTNDKTTYEGQPLNSYDAAYLKEHCNYYYEFYNNILKALGQKEIENLAELLYYYEVFPAKLNWQYDIALRYAQAQGVTFTADLLGGDANETVTADNTSDLVNGLYPPESGNDNEWIFYQTYKAAPLYMPRNTNSQTTGGKTYTRYAYIRNQNLFKAYYKLPAYDLLFPAGAGQIDDSTGYDKIYRSYCYTSVYDVNDTYYRLVGLRQTVPTYMSIVSPYYKEITMGMVKDAYKDKNQYQTNADIENEFVTAEQIQALYDFAKANNWGSDASLLKDYLDSNANPFSKTATAYLKALIADKKSAMDAFTGAIAGCSDANAVAELVIDDYSNAFGQEIEAPGYAEIFSTKGFMDRVNTMIPSQLLMDIVPEDLKEEVAIVSQENIPGVTSGIHFYDYFAYMIANKPAESAEDDLANKTYSYNDYKINDELMVYLVNTVLNTIVSNALAEGATVGDLLNDMLQTKLDLVKTLTDVWLNLYEEPIKTVVNLLPTVLIVVDEALLPMLLHDENDVAAGDLTKSLMADKNTLLFKHSQKAGNTDVGLGKFYFDLNTILPSVLHWLTGDKEGAKAIAGTYANVADTPKLDAEGNPVKDEGGNPVITHYDDNVVKFLDVYMVDKAITNASNIKELLENLGAKLEPGTVEILDELIHFAREAVDDYMANHKDDKRFGKENMLSKETGKLQSGLNYLPVSLPYLIDAIGQKFIQKYHVKSDWTFVYSGKIIDKEFSEGGVTGTQKINAHYQAFKDLAKENNPAKVLNQLVDLLIGNWINALLDFLNDTLMDDSNDIMAKIPLVQGLVAAVGGFGEQSILTDVFNGFFQLKRSDNATFTMEKREKTGFVGFSNTVGFYLICNLQYEKQNETRGLIPFIRALTQKTDKKPEEQQAAQPTAPTVENAKKIQTLTAQTDFDKLLTDDNLKAAQKLVDVLDELLSSLLANTSLNGFDFDSTDNILSGVVTMFAAYFGGRNTNDLIKLLNNYLFFVTGETQVQPSKKGKIGILPTDDGDVDKNKVYTSANLSNLVIQTYSFVENLIDYLFYNKDKGILAKQDPNMLIADAAYGIISPDAVAVRLSDKYKKTADILKDKDYLNWNSFKVQATALNADNQLYYTKDFLKYGFSNGDKTAFYEALGESLNGIAGILGAVLTTSYVDSKRSGNLYSEVLYPVFKNLADGVGADGVMSVADFNKATPAQQLTKGIITPIGNILALIYDKPATFLLNLVKGLAGVLEDSVIAKIFGGITGTVDVHVNGVIDIVNYLSPTYAQSLKTTLDKALSGFMGTFKNLPKENILISLLNKPLGEKLGVNLAPIDWKRINTAKSPAEVLLLIYGYAVDTLLKIDLIKNLLDSLDPSISKVLQQLDAAQILTIITQILAVVQSPTEVFWTFSEYAHKLTNTFKYPKGITASRANDAVEQLDNLVNNVFPLLNSLGVTDIQGLDTLINDKLYTNEIVTTIAKALYGAIGSNKTVTDILQAALGMDVTPKGLAGYLMDKSYGKTYSAAAKTLKKAKSWDKVKSLNWGFKNGSKNAQTGFINALAASLRPFNDILALLLVEGDSFGLTNLDIRSLINTLATKGSTEILTDKGEYAATLEYKLKNGKFSMTIQSYATTGSGKRTVKSLFEIDVDAVVASVEDILRNIRFNFGTNGYENAVIPILEAFMCDGIKTYKQYQKDYAKAKDNLLINILKPVGKLIDTVAAKPFDTLTAILPNVAYFLDSNGLTQAIGNLLAPITSDKGILGVLKKNGLDVDKLLKAILGKDLGKVITDLLDTNIKFRLELGNLKACNFQDLILPIIRKLTKKLGIVIPNFTWKQLASHGTVKTVKSKARNDEGTFLTEQVQARQGEVLVAVLRYVSDALIKNAKPLKKLISGIDAIKKNATLKSIIGCVFDQIGTAEKDDIVNAVFYLLNGAATDRFFDYRNFKYKDYTFSWGNLDEDFCRKLAPMLDGLVGGLVGEKGLNGLIADNLYKDELIGKLATGLYGAIEGVKISDDIGSLTNLLALTDIDFSTDNVAKLLTDRDYGQSYSSAASVIRKAGSWKNVKAENLKFGVKDRDSFMHALVAVLRPIYGVLDVLLNDASLNLFNLINIPGSDGYTSTIVPLLEAFGVYNIKTQYEYREDIYHEYDSILLDIINPLWDKVEDILSAPLEMLADILPNLSLFFANDGLLQIVENLLTPVSALLEALRPIVDINELLKAAGLNVPKLLKEKAGLSVSKFDVYDLSGTLKPLVGADKVVGTINSVLKIIKIKGTPLNLELPEIDWYRLASHGEYILDATSQAATFGGRIAVKSDQDETFIAVLRFLIDTIKYKDNLESIKSLLASLLPDTVPDSVSDIISQVLAMFTEETDSVIEQVVDLLQTIAG